MRGTPRIGCLDSEPMATMPPAAARRLQTRVLENDRRIIDAGVEALADTGWSGLSFQAVATRAGVSRRTAQNRYPDIAALASAVWQRRCSGALEAALTAVLEAAPGSPQTLTAALNRLHHPNDELAAAAELLALSQFHTSLLEAIRGSVGTTVRSWCDPERSTAAGAAANAFILSVALGLLFAARANGSEGVDLIHEVAPLSAALHALSEPTALPQEPAAYLTADPPFGTGDPTHDALLLSVLEHVASAGFDGSSVDRIAATAGVTTGALFARYPTKLDLFIDATRRQQALSMPAAQEYMTQADAQYGSGVGMALNIRESQRPARAHLRAIGLEQVRVSWHNQALREARQAEVAAFAEAVLLGNAGADPGALRANVHMGVALGIGIAVLPILDPDCWSLPYDAVTVPLARREA